MLNLKNSICVSVSKELIKEDHPNDKAKQKQILERVKEANRSRTTVVRKCVLKTYVLPCLVSEIQFKQIYIECTI